MRFTPTALLCATALAFAACHTPRDAAGGGTAGARTTPRIGHKSRHIPTGLSIDDRLVDANGNGVDDATDISNGTSKDLNKNGIPDEAE